MRNRRRYSREHFELRGANLYREGNWLPLPQSIIRAVMLGRFTRGLWAPEYPSVEPVKIGDDLALELIAASRTRQIATA